MIDLAEPLAQVLALTPPPPNPVGSPGGAMPGGQPSSVQPIAQLVFIIMGLTIATIVLVAGLLAIAMLRRTRRSASPTRTAHVDAWAESGKRAMADPSARDILGDDDDR